MTDRRIPIGAYLGPLAVFCFGVEFALLYLAAWWLL